MRRSLLAVLMLAFFTFSGVAHAFPTGEENLWIFPTSNEELVFNAEHCVKDTHVFLYRKSSGCNGGKNEEWTIKKLSATYDEHVVIYALYGEQGYECLNVSKSEYKEWTPIYAEQCSPSEPSPNELFRQPEHTEDPYGGGDWLVPASQPIEDQYCLNAEHGVHEEARIILWVCNNQANEDWWFG